MNPSDLGLPSKFGVYRAGQVDAILSAAGSDYRFSLISAATGSGKSLIYMSVSQLLGCRTLVLTGTKGLQQQLHNDFAPIGLADIRGQNNYRCVGFDPGFLFDRYGHPGDTCDKGPCHLGIQCGFRAAGCLYYDAIRKAAQSRVVVANYAFWMTMNRYADPEALGEFGLLILDEADTAPDELNDFCAIDLDAHEVKAILGMSLPPIDEGQEVWAEWAVQAHAKARQKYKETFLELQDLASDRRALTRYLRRISDLGKPLKELAKVHNWRRADNAVPDVLVPGMQTDWVAEKTDKGLRFSPVWAHAYAEELLFRNIPRVILTSATLSRAVARYLGIPADAFEYREYASTFNPERRPLIYLPTTTVDRHMTEGQIRVWINKIDQIVAGRTDRKGIIHTRSYERAQLVLTRSRFRNQMLGHGGRNTRDVVADFKQRTGGWILVSPSMETGWDFPGDQCRYQIIAKVPFVDSRSPVIKARTKSDKTYLNYLTARSIIQMVGRGMRSADDWCETFIIDDHIDWMWSAMKKGGLLPRWFMAAFRRMTGVPAALVAKFGGIKKRG